MIHFQHRISRWNGTSTTTTKFNSSSKNRLSNLQAFKLFSFITTIAQLMFYMADGLFLKRQWTKTKRVFFWPKTNRKTFLCTSFVSVVNENAKENKILCVRYDSWSFTINKWPQKTNTTTNSSSLDNKWQTAALSDWWITTPRFSKAQISTYFDCEVCSILIKNLTQLSPIRNVESSLRNRKR